jgi:hypothetical protein
MGGIDQINRRQLEENEKMVEIITSVGYFSCSGKSIINGVLAENIKIDNVFKTTWNFPINIPVQEKNEFNFYSIGKNIKSGVDIPIEILNTTTTNQVLFFGGFYSTNAVDSVVSIDTQCKTQYIWGLARKIGYSYELFDIQNTNHKIKRVRTINKKIYSIKLFVHQTPRYIYNISFKKNENLPNYSINIGVGEICIDII